MPNTIEGTGRMIAAIDKKYTIKEIGAPKPISSETQYDAYVSALADLESHNGLTATEKDFAELLTLLIEAYEDKHYPIEDAAPVEVLRELMAANDLRQKDLASLFGSESVVSEVLNGKRELNKRQIERLSEKFKVSPAVFF
jgi:HTH-type transcriptional regulator / antitoxin HigA